MDLLKDILSKMKAAMRDYDISAINEASKKLQAFTHTTNIDDPVLSQDIKKILRYKLIGEYDDAMLLIDKLL